MSVFKQSLAMILVISMLLSMFTFVSYANEASALDITEDLLPTEFPTTEEFEDETDEESQETETDADNSDDPSETVGADEDDSENTENENITDDPDVDDSESSESSEPSDDDNENEGKDIEEKNDELSDDGSDNGETPDDGEVPDDDSEESDASTEDAELMIDWLYKDRVVEIAVNDAVARKNPKSSASVMKRYSVGDFVKIVDKKPFTEWYKTDEGYWIYGANFREHKHSAVIPTTRVWFEHKNDKKHVRYTKTEAAVCRCGTTVQKYKENKKNENHSYNSVGYCSLCEYNYPYSVKRYDSVLYKTKQSVTLRTQPYDASGAAGNVNNGVLLNIVGETKNQKGNKWFLTSGGQWVFSGWVAKHSHDYNNSTGYCSCGAGKPYSTASTKSVEKWEVKSGLYLKTRPFSGAENATYVNVGTVLSIDGYTYSSILWIKNPSWYRTTDGYWVYEDNVKKHTHSYSGGLCQSEGCGDEYPLKIESIKGGSAVQYQTANNGIAVRVAPYNNRQVANRIPVKGTVVLIKAKAKNSVGNIWYQTSDGSWIYSNDVFEHKHNIVAGSCQNVNCNFSYSVIPTILNEKTYVTALENVQSYNKPYFDSQVVKVYRARDSYVVINAEFKNNKDERWYRAVNGEWFYFDSLRAHSHSYKNGVCKSCGADEPLQITTITPTLYETKKINISLYNKPYDTSTKVKTLKAKGTAIKVIGLTYNGEGKLWYMTSDNYWAYSENVSRSLSMKYGDANLTGKDKFVLRVVDSNKKGIANATVTFDVQSGTTNAQGYVELYYTTVSSTLKVVANNYETLIIKDCPLSPLRTATVTLSQEGMPEITSAVFSRNGEYTDVIHNEVIANQASNGLRFNLTLTSNVKNVKEYRLVQNNKTMLTSKDGKFTKLVADDFMRDVSIVAQVVDTDGVVKASRKLMISVIYKAGDLPDSISLGKDITVKLSENLPFPFAGESIKIGLPALPLNVDVNEEYIRVGINFKLYDSSDSIGEKETKWDYIKRLNKNKFKGFYEKNALKQEKASVGEPFKWEVKVGGYAEGSVGSAYLKGKIFVSVECSKWQETQLVAYPPIVGEISFEGKVQADGSIQISKLGMSGDLSVSLTAEIGVYAGVGFAGLMSIGAYGNGSLTFDISVLPSAYLDSISVTAEFGVKGKIFGKDVLNVKLIQLGDYYLYKRGAELSEALEGQTKEDYYAWLYDTDSYQPMDRSYLNERSGWYEADAKLLEDKNIVLSQFDFETLQSNTYTDIRPQVATAGNTILMAYIDDNAERDDDNRTMLVYSLYNADTQKWSVPAAVYDDGMADFNFNLVSNGSDIYVVWQKATQKITSEMKVTDISKVTDLYIAKFDEAMSSFQNIEQVTTNNKIYEMMPRVSSVNGKTIVTWFENSEGDVYGQNGFNRIRYAVKADKDYAPGPESDISGDEFLPADTEIENPIEVDDETIPDEEQKDTGKWTIYDVDKDLPAITSLAVGYMLDDGYIAFTIDEDKNYNTIDDQKIYLVSMQTNEVILYTDKGMNVEFVKVHGDNAMTWYNKGYIYYSYSPDYAPQMIYSDAGIPCDEYHIISSGSGDMAILYTIKSDNQSDAYVILYDDETFEWGLPVQVTKQDKYVQNFNGAYYDEMIVSIFNKTDVNKETLFEKNDLCCAVIGERYDLMIGNVVFEDCNLEAGAEYPLTIEVKNNGTRRIKSFNLAIRSQGVAIDEKTVEASIKPGETYTVETSIVMPEEIEPTIYTIEIDDPEIADADISNNTYDLNIGRANMFIEVATSEEDSQNMLYVTVVNKGYTASSGSIVLYNENFEIVKTLIDSIDEIGYYETYNCTIALDNEVFNGEMYKSFFIGVVPTAEQYMSDYNATSVYLKNAKPAENAQVEVSDADLVSGKDDVGLMDAYQKTVVGSIRNEQEYVLENAKIVGVAFDSNGICLSTQFLDATLDIGESADFSFTFETEAAIHSVKVYIMNPTTMEILSDFTEISVYDTSSDEQSVDEDVYKEILEVEEEY